MNSVIAIVAAVFGFGGIAVGAAGIAKVLFFIFLILFIVFYLESVFLIPWGVAFRGLGVFGFVEMLIFIGVLLVGLAYVWKKGALQWD